MSAGAVLAHEAMGRRLREGGMLVAFAVACYLLLALVDYSPQDPGWAFVGPRDQVINAAGSMGAWFASVLFSLFGVFAYLFPLAIVYAGWRLFRDERDDIALQAHIWMVRGFGLVFTLAAGTALIAIHDYLFSAQLPEGPGGIIGKMIRANLIGATNPEGGSLLLVALFLIGITWLTGLSWVLVMEAIGGMVLETFRGGHALLLRGIDWHRDRKAKKKRVEAIVTEKKRVEKKPPLKVEPKVVEIKPSIRVEKEKQMALIEPEPNSELPPLSLLDPPQHSGHALSEEALQAMSRQVELKLADFGVQAEVVAVHPGPVVTLFELNLAAGTKVSKVTNLAKDLARSLSTISVRVVETIPGRPVIGIEIPNEVRETVYLSEVLRSEAYDKAKSKLTMVLGKDIVGNPVVADLAKMPHALIAGTTGSGKSVAINTMIMSLVYKAKPSEVRMIMIDPKMLELSVYEGIPHLLCPVVTDMKEAANALRWCVAEMERRYKLMAALGVRNLTGYNKKIKQAEDKGEPILDPFFKPEEQLEIDAQPPALTHMPLIVVVIDELADMMMVVGKKVEELIARIAQKARAAGIHLLLATQRPSVDVITGLIKANIPTRMAFQVASRIDSRTILDQMGAEHLLGHGDMLFLPAGTSIPRRTHGAFVDDHEVHRVANHLRQAGEPDYVEEILAEPSEAIPGLSAEASGVETEEVDELFDQAVAIVTETRRASISGVQRRLKIGYNRAARLVEEMERIGIVSGADSKGNREVLAPPPPSD